MTKFDLTRRAALGLAMTLPVAVRAETFAGQYDPRAENVGDGIWMVAGADEPIAFSNGGAIANSAFMATDEGTILFDPGPSRNYALKLSQLAQDVTGKPVSRVYISHLHPDHAFGASAFDPQIVHALPATRAELERDGPDFSDAMYRMLADWMKGTELHLPQGDVTGGDIRYGGRALQMFSLSGHSGGDLAILDVKSGVLLGGDLVFYNRAPATPHADLTSWRTSLATLGAIDCRLIVPGHGPLDKDKASIAQTLAWLDWLEGALNEAVASGMDMTEAGNMPIPERFASIKLARYELQRSVSHFYPELEAELLPPIDN